MHYAIRYAAGETNRLRLWDENQPAIGPPDSIVTGWTPPML